MGVYSCYDSVFSVSCSVFHVYYESVCFPLLYIPAFLLYSVLYSLWVPYLCYVICFCAVLCVCVISRDLSRGSFGNSLSTSSEVEVWTAYILPPPDPTKWEYTGFVVVVVVTNGKGIFSPRV